MVSKNILTECNGFFSFLFLLIKPYKKAIITISTASILLILFNIVSSMYLRYLFDDVIFSQSELTLHVLSIGIIIITVFTVLLNIIKNYFMANLNKNTDLIISFSYFDKLLKLPVEHFDKYKTGDFTSRLEDIQKIQYILSDIVVTLFMDSFMVIIIGIVLFFQSYILFFVALLFIILSMLCALFFWGIYNKYYKNLAIKNADASSYIRLVRKPD
ncbi:putative Lactococcin-G-processing and transport ATP-binding protein LagD [Hollandina sp. SP2]